MGLGNHEAYGSVLDKEEKNILDACNASATFTI